MSIWTWAVKAAEKKYGKLPARVSYALALESEYKRTLRLIGKLEKRAQLDQFSRTAAAKAGYLEALADLRAALTKGRT